MLLKATLPSSSSPLTVPKSKSLGVGVRGVRWSCLVRCCPEGSRYCGLVVLLLQFVGVQKEQSCSPVEVVGKDVVVYAVVVIFLSLCMLLFHCFGCGCSCCGSSCSSCRSRDWRKKRGEEEEGERGIVAVLYPCHCARIKVMPGIGGSKCSSNWIMLLPLHA